MERSPDDQQRGAATPPFSAGSLRFGLLPFAARLLLIGEFAVALNGKIFGWSGQADYMRAKGMTFVVPLLGAALAIELLGSLCLLTGFRTRTAASVMFVYLGIVTVRLHDFWHGTGMSSMLNTGEFFKNLGMMGGLLMIAVYGPGRWSVDAGRSRDPA